MTITNLPKHLWLEDKIINTSADYLIFIDETGDPTFHQDAEIYSNPSVAPIMSISAVLLSTQNYRQILMPGMDNLKFKYWNNYEVIFHSKEIRNHDGIFKNLIDPIIYSNFKQDINQLINQSGISIISSSINKQKLLKKATEYKSQTGQQYNVGDIYLRNVEYILERIGHFLHTNLTGKIVFETRGKKESRRIQAVLTNACKNGTFYCDKNRFTQINPEIAFFTKLNNINGLQLVDYICYPFARYAKSKNDPNNQFFQFLKQYIYKGDYGQYGLKIWP